jgi:glutamyl-tRNA synthetase
MTVRTRIAPSPTGDPHVGTAYVALFNYAFARHNGGQFILRIEDTDRERSSAASEAMIFEALHWLGLGWDEGPDVGGPHGPYRQSERTAVYREHAESLVEKGAAYPCFCTRNRLESLRAEQKAKKLNFGYDGHCRALPPEEAASRRATEEPCVIRLAMPREGKVAVRDLLRGEIEFDNAQIDDQILLKTDGFPTYHLANVVDDHLMGITHVIRAEEWLSSLPKHLRLYEGFGWETPVFCHLPLLRNADRSKISKRKNPVSLNFYRGAGYFPEALVNYLALMGWAMPDEREEFSLKEFVQELTLERISLGGPVFDLEKLKWLNGKYVRRMSTEELAGRLLEGPLSRARLLDVLPLVHERIDTLEEFFSSAGFFFTGDVAWDDEASNAMVPKGRSAAETAKVLKQLLEDEVDRILDWRAEDLEEALRRFGEAKGWKAKELFMTVRVAATGRTASPPLFETLAVLGKEACRRRLRGAIETLRGVKP